MKLYPNVIVRETCLSFVETLQAKLLKAGFGVHIWSCVAEAALDKVYVGNEALDNVLHFEYLGSQLQGDGEDEADVCHRMDVAQARSAH